MNLAVSRQKHSGHNKAKGADCHRILWLQGCWRTLFCCINLNCPFLMPIPHVAACTGSKSSGSPMPLRYKLFFQSWFRLSLPNSTLWHCIGSLMTAVMGVFIPWKSENATHKCFFLVTYSLLLVYAYCNPNHVNLMHFSPMYLISATWY